MRVSFMVHCVLEAWSHHRSFYIVASIDGRKFRLCDLSPDDERAVEWISQADDAERVVAAARDLFPAGGPAPEPMTYDLAAELLTGLSEAGPAMEATREWASSGPPPRTRAIVDLHTERTRRCRRA